MIRFIRTTKAFPKEAKSLLRGQAGFVLHMLDSKTPQTLDEVIESCHSHARQWKDGSVTKATIAYSLLRLIEFGMVGIG
ncbi:MAG: hypothetical protein E3J66_00160 [Dehalococcoidia bacterium]|nr:MAG: hypothetical protein E3J66_00160 [Dehalococcoidia bacterium]